MDIYRRVCQNVGNVRSEFRIGKDIVHNVHALAHRQRFKSMRCWIYLNKRPLNQICLGTRMQCTKNVNNNQFLAHALTTAKKTLLLTVLYITAECEKRYKYLIKSR